MNFRVQSDLRVNSHLSLQSDQRPPEMEVITIDDEDPESDLAPLELEDVEELVTGEGELQALSYGLLDSVEWREQVFSPTSSS